MYAGASTELPSAAFKLLFLSQFDACTCKPDAAKVGMFTLSSLWVHEKSFLWNWKSVLVSGLSILTEVRPLKQRSVFRWERFPKMHQEQVSIFLGSFQRQPVTQLFCPGKWKMRVTFYCPHFEAFHLDPCNPKPTWTPVSNPMYEYHRPVRVQPLAIPTLQRQNIWISPVVWLALCCLQHG